MAVWWLNFHVVTLFLIVFTSSEAFQLSARRCSPRLLQQQGLKSLITDVGDDDESFKKFAATQIEGFIPTVNTFDPDKIPVDSFAWFLKEEFVRVTGSDDAKVQMTFNQFFDWRSTMGTNLTVEELHDLWELVLDQGYLANPNEADCSLEMFIKINNVIDEQ